MFLEGPIPQRLLEAAMNEKETASGARLFFAGTVRADDFNGSVVKAIEFTAQQTLCEMIKEQIIEESRIMYSINSAEVYHSLGRVNAGQACFLVTVQCGHRREGFEALRYIVDEFKKRCPVFGKELMENGQYQWKENTL